jgi:hypothetical protein
VGLDSNALAHCQRHLLDLAATPSVAWQDGSGPVCRIAPLRIGEYRHASGAAALAWMSRGFRPSLRTLAIAAMILISGDFPSFAQTQRAQQNGQWCAYFSGGPTNCSFTTFEQCLAAIRGKAGLCDHNQHASSAQPTGGA